MADPAAPPSPTLEDMQRELTVQKMKSAVLEVRLAYPTLPDKLLGFYQGPPEGLIEYAKNLDTELKSLTPPAPAVPAPTAPVPPSPAPAAPVAVAAPAPAPGPGASVTPDTSSQLRLRELRDAALNKQLNVRNFKSGPGNEGEEYFDLALIDGLVRSGVVHRRAS